MALSGYPTNLKHPVAISRQAARTICLGTPLLRRRIMADSKNVIELSDDNFEEEVLKESRPVLVDFWAVWCAPCRIIAPVIEEIAETYGAKIKVGKVNVDENSKIPNQYGIRSIPTVMLFKDGQVAEQVIGANAAEIKKIVEQNA
jgi:thioredoxin 1